MRAILLATSLIAGSLGATLAGSCAMAQKTPAQNTSAQNTPAQNTLAQNDPWCLMTGPAQECDFFSMQQCLASKRGNADFCEPNNTYPNRGSSGYQDYMGAYSPG